MMQIGVSAKLYFDAPDRGKALDKIIDSQKDFIEAAKTGWRYYGNENDICNISPKTAVDKKYEQTVTNPLRNADNRIPHPFHQLLVNQKAGYLFGKMVLIRADHNDYNAELKPFCKRLHPRLKELCVDSSNAAVSYLHPYITPDGIFDFVKIPAVEGIPLWGSVISRPLDGFVRHYQTVSPDQNENAKIAYKAEVWTAGDVTYYTKQQSGFTMDASTPAAPNPAPHFYKGDQAQSFGMVPFIVFKNNEICMSDLVNVKKLIDIYDKTISLYSNDIEDLQELIFVLINYGGQDLGEFLNDLKTYKAIKVDKGGSGTDGGVETLKVDIPVEARIKLLEILKRNIWSCGQGVDPEQVPTNPSGAALKHLYGMLELKASFAESGFIEGINALLSLFKCWLKLSTGADYSNETEDIIFTRSMISNDAEVIEMAANSKNIISDETIVANHPWVDDAAGELAKLRAQQVTATKQMSDAFLNSDISPTAASGGEN